MKKYIFALTVMLSICSLLNFAFAAKNCETYGSVTVYSGPWDLYPEICVLPTGMKIQAIEYELNEEDGKLWHLVEFSLGGKMYRGYADENAPIAFESASGYSEADHSGERICYVKRDASVYAAPFENAAIIGDVYADENVTMLAEDGNYALIDYEQYGQPCRGYILADDTM